MTLTSSDPEPLLGTIVRDINGERWQRRMVARVGWFAMDEDDDPRSWTKLAGNYGPVRSEVSPEG